MDNELAAYMERIATSFEQIAKSLQQPAAGMAAPDSRHKLAGKAEKSKPDPADPGKAKPAAVPDEMPGRFLGPLVEFSLDQVRDALIPLGAVAREILTRHQCSRLSDLDPAQYGSVIAEAGSLRP